MAGCPVFLLHAATLYMPRTLSIKRGSLLLIITPSDLNPFECFTLF